MLNSKFAWMKDFYLVLLFRWSGTHLCSTRTHTNEDSAVLIRYLSNWRDKTGFCFFGSGGTHLFMEIKTPLPGANLPCSVQVTDNLRAVKVTTENKLSDVPPQTHNIQPLPLDWTVTDNSQLFAALCAVFDSRQNQENFLSLCLPLSLSLSVCLSLSLSLSLFLSLEDKLASSAVASNELLWPQDWNKTPSPRGNFSLPASASFLHVTDDLRLMAVTGTSFPKVPPNTPLPAVTSQQEKNLSFH